MSETRWSQVVLVACVALGLQAIRGTVADLRGAAADARAKQDSHDAALLGRRLNARLTDTLCLASWPRDTSGPVARDSLRRTIR